MKSAFFISHFKMSKCQNLKNVINFAQVKSGEDIPEAFVFLIKAVFMPLLLKFFNFFIILKFKILTSSSCCCKSIRLVYIQIKYCRINQKTGFFFTASQILYSNCTYFHLPICQFENIVLENQQKSHYSYKWGTTSMHMNYFSLFLCFLVLNFKLKICQKVGYSVNTYILDVYTDIFSV